MRRLSACATCTAVANMGADSNGIRLAAVLAAIDQANSSDPGSFQGRPLAQAEGEIACAWVERLSPDAADVVRIAARAHHLRRWAVPRADYPQGRAGYLRWRRDQKRRHAEDVAELMAEAGYGGQERQRVSAIIMKRRLASDPEVQLYEDAVALTFLETQFSAIADRLDNDHMAEVLRKTLAKMTVQGCAAAADIDLAPRLKALLSQAVG